MRTSTRGSGRRGSARSTTSPISWSSRRCWACAKRRCRCRTRSPRRCSRTRPPRPPARRPSQRRRADPPMLRKAFALAAAVGLLAAAPALAATSQAPLKQVDWSFKGPFGQYDQQQLQRGFKVYHDVCSTCHALTYINFYNLGEPGGPFWNPKYPNANDNPVVKAIAAQYKVMDVDPDSGDMKPRTATTADHIPPPYANDIAAKATLGGAPPDLSTVEKAREGGADYTYSLLTGYPASPPAVLD